MTHPPVPLRFLWSMSAAGDTFKGARARAEQNGLPNLEAHLRFCRRAEEMGIESLLTAFGFHRADPIALSAALGVLTQKVKFLVACRPGVMSPTLFVQQVNSVAALAPGRICLNLVTGHSSTECKGYGDFQAREDRYRRAEEFLHICTELWTSQQPVDFTGDFYRLEGAQLRTPFVGAVRPEIYLGGSSEEAVQLALRYADCLLTLPCETRQLATRIQPLVAAGKGVGLLVSLIARPSRAEALTAADTIIAQFGEKQRRVHRSFQDQSDSKVFNETIASAQDDHQWLGPCLWQGAVPYLGAPAIALVGAYDEIARTMMTYKEMGIGQFLLKGWPDEEEMGHFGKVFQEVRRLEAEYQMAGESQ